MTRQEAIACGAKRYIGKVCSKHPEAGGERFAVNKTCAACQRQHRARHRASEKGREKGRERGARYRASLRYAITRTRLQIRKRAARIETALQEREP